MPIKPNLSCVAVPIYSRNLSLPDALAWRTVLRREMRNFEHDPVPRRARPSGSVHEMTSRVNQQ